MKSTGYKQWLNMALLTSLFFWWGFITILNDIMMPHLQDIFVMTHTKTSLIQFTFFGAYGLMSFPSGWFVRRTSYKRGVVVGLLITALGAFLFYPASLVINYYLFLAAFFILASGITLLQVAANPFVTLLGSSQNASARLNLSQALNSLGTTLAPLVGGTLIFIAEDATSIQKAEAVQLPYIGIAIFLVALAMLFYMAKLPKIMEETSKRVLPLNSGKHNAWQYKHLRLGAIAIFVYVGAEVAIGSFMVKFFMLDEIAGFTKDTAKLYLSLYWGGAMIGRFFGAISLSGIRNIKLTIVFYLLILVGAFTLVYFGILPFKLFETKIFLGFVVVNMIAFIIGKKSPSRTLAVFAIVAIVLVSYTVLFSGREVVWSLLSVGMFNSIMFPTIFSLAIKDLGMHTSQGSGLLVFAIVGGAFVPLLMGIMADTIGLHQSFGITLICYAYIVYYGLKGYKIQQPLGQK